MERTVLQASGDRDPEDPIPNLRAFLDYSELNYDDSLASISLPGPVANYDPGGETTGVTKRWSVPSMEVKKFIDDVSGCEKVHAGDVYKSNIVNDDEIRYIRAPQAQALFDKVNAEAASKGMKLNSKKTTFIVCQCGKIVQPEDLH